MAGRSLRKAVDVGKELAGIRLRALRGEAERVQDDARGFVVDTPRLRFPQHTGLAQVLLEDGDGIAVFRLRDLVLAAIRLEQIGGPVTREARGEHLHRVRAAGRAYLCDDAGGEGGARG